MYKDCDLVKDMLPLYAEQLLSDGSREFIDAHCDGCAACSAERDALLERNAEGKQKAEREERVWLDLAKKQKAQKRKTRIRVISIIAASVLAVVIGVSVLLHMLFTALDQAFPTVTPQGSFDSVEEAMQAYADNVVRVDDIDYDVWPPFRVLYQETIGDKAVVLYSSYYEPGQSEEDYSYRVEYFQITPEGKYVFDGGDWLYTPDEEDYRLFVDSNFSFTETDRGSKIINVYYLPADSEKNIYIKDNKAEKHLVSDGTNEFQFCVLVRDGEPGVGRLISSMTGSDNAVFKE